MSVDLQLVNRILSTHLERCQEYCCQTDCLAIHQVALVLNAIVEIKPKFYCATSTHSLPIGIQNAEL